MLKRLLILTSLFALPLYAQLTPTLRQTTKFSVRELEDWLKKQDRPNYVIPSSYTIAGQVVAKWKNVHESLGGVNQVGKDTPTSNNQYTIDTEFQLLYLFGRTFGNARLVFRNKGGIFSGTSNSIALNRAYIGYHFVTYGPHTVDINIGRRDMNKLYNSALMFKSSADGVTGFIFYNWDKIFEIQGYSGLYTSNPGSFWVARGRLFNIANLGFYIDYDFIYWGKVKPSSNLTQIQTRYAVSQFLIGWERKPKWIGTNVQAFAAILVNSLAKRHPLSNGKYENLAGYVGVQYGATKKKGQFSFQGQLQFCQLQAVPEWDMAGIGRGNSAKGDLFKAGTLDRVNGNTNFKGFELKLNYALTDQITAGAVLKHSNNLSDRIGLPSSYTDFAISTTYIF